jgi:peptide-methionine (S)-S-oxide reductase
MNKIILFLLSLCNISCISNAQETSTINKEKTKKLMQNGNEIATFAGGCFWCTEAVFFNIKGVQSVTSGYIGGKSENPTYKEICTGQTGHAEAIQIVFNSSEVTFGELLELFFATHDPTTLNRQGADVGTQYRSEVFYHNENQKKLTEKYIQLLLHEQTFGFGKSIVTAISPAVTFYPAEDYHQNYYNQNKEQGYCSYVITPKIEKLQLQFKSKLKN